MKKELKVVQQRRGQHNSPCSSALSWRGLSLAIVLPVAESHSEVPTGDAPVAPERGGGGEGENRL